MLNGSVASALVASTFANDLQFDFDDSQPLFDVLKVSFCDFGALFCHLLVQHGHLELLLRVYNAALSQLCQLLCVRQFAARRDQFRLLLIELGLQLRPERDERLGLIETRLEFAYMPRVVRTLRLENADLCAKLLHFGVIYDSLRRLCIGIGLKR